MQRISLRFTWLKNHRWLVTAVLALLLVRLYWAANIPLGNDEAYYWDWARSLQMSYVDHPPGVAWLALLAKSMGPQGALQARLLAPFLHLLATLLLGATGRFLLGRPFSNAQNWTWFLVTQWMPGFSLGGFFLLPDTGLLLALALVAFQGVRVITRRRMLRLDDGLLLGGAYGLAGLFKYMTLPLALGGLLALVLSRRDRLAKEAGFWLALLVTSGALVLPVISWNAAHGWASIRFQASHGFEGSAFGLITALRFWVGVALMVSPWVLGQCILEGGRYLGLPAAPTAGFGDGTRGERRLGGFFLVWSAAPWGLLLFSQAWFKQLLPHWIVPAVWMVLPLLFGSVSGAKAMLRKRVLCYGGLFVGLAFALSSAGVRQQLIDFSGQRPGPLGELTFWEPLAAAVAEKLPPDQVLIRPQSTLDCAGGKKILASLRWYWASQLSYAFPGQPEVISLDMDHASFYHQRNDLRDLEGCFVVVIADRRHVDRTALVLLLDLKSEELIEVSSHQDVQIVMVTGYLRAQRAQELYPLVKGL